MALIESGLSEFGLRRSFSGRWARNRNTSDVELDQQAGARLAEQLKIRLPRTWDGRALAGAIGNLERHGMSKPEIRRFAAQQLEQLEPEKRPEPAFKSERKPQTTEDRATLEAMAVSEHTSPGTRALVNEELHRAKKPKRRRKPKPTALAPLEHVSLYDRARQLTGRGEA